MYVNNYGGARPRTTQRACRPPSTSPVDEQPLIECVVYCLNVCVATNTGSYSAAEWNGSNWSQSPTFASSANINLGVNAISVSQCRVLQWTTATCIPPRRSVVVGADSFDATGRSRCFRVPAPLFCAAGDIMDTRTPRPAGLGGFTSAGVHTAPITIGSVTPSDDGEPLAAPLHLRRRQNPGGQHRPVCPLVVTLDSRWVRRR